MTIHNQRYPSWCAHRGLSALCPENTLPAFAASIALGAPEIELDVRLTRDRQLVVQHDDTLERISNGQGLIGHHTLAALKELNIGVHKGWDLSFSGIREVFDALRGTVIMNIHVKESGEDGYVLKTLAALIRQYALSESVYIAGNPEVLTWAREYMPEIPRCLILFDLRDRLEEALSLGCSRVQFWRERFTQEQLDGYHAHDILCNLFWSDEPEDMRRHIEMGIDVILTNRADLAARVFGSSSK